MYAAPGPAPQPPKRVFLGKRKAFGPSPTLTDGGNVRDKVWDRGEDGGACGSPAVV